MYELLTQENQPTRSPESMTIHRVPKSVTKCWLGLTDAGRLDGVMEPFDLLDPGGLDEVPA